MTTLTRYMLNAQTSITGGSDDRTVCAVLHGLKTDLANATVPDRLILSEKKSCTCLNLLGLNFIQARL